jgi:hypothetical protein
MSCEWDGHVGAEDAGNQPRYRCLYCGEWGYRSHWRDNCCENDGENLTPEGEKIYPDECDHECHMSDADIVEAEEEELIDRA